MSGFSQPNLITEETTESRTENIYAYKIILYNDAINEFSHVEDCLMKICFKSKREAKSIAIEAHNKGHAICFLGSLEECETIAEKLTNERLTVSIQT